MARNMYTIHLVTYIYTVFLLFFPCLILCKMFTDLKKAVVLCEGGSSRDADVVEKKLTNMHRLVTASHGWDLGLTAALTILMFGVT